MVQAEPFVIFHQLGSGANGSRPRETRSSGDGTGSGEVSSAHRVQRDGRLQPCQVQARSTTGDWTTGRQTLTAAVRWKPTWLRWLCVSDKVLRQSCRTMDRVVRCWEKLPNWSSSKTTRLQFWRGASGTSNNWVQRWKLFWSRAPAESWQRWLEGFSVWALETNSKLGTQSISSSDQWWNWLRRWGGSFRQSVPRTWMSSNWQSCIENWFLLSSTRKMWPTAWRQQQLGTCFPRTYSREIPRWTRSWCSSESCVCQCGKNWQDASCGVQSMDIGQVHESEGEGDDVNAVQQRRRFDRSNQKHKQESDNERKAFNRRTANSSPRASRQ